MTAQYFYSNGKFLITGEYLVLKGATALALPLKFGQHMNVIPDTNADFHIRWKASVENNFWFETIMDIDSLAIIETNDINKAKRLQEILSAARELNPLKLKNSQGFDVKTNIDFNINWGLGSSSSLISNIASWFNIDPYALHFATSSGSGYDIACAHSNGSIFYTLNSGKPLVEETDFSPDFSDKLYFVYLGKKQQSDKSIIDFAARLNSKDLEIERISEISCELIATHDLEEFEFFIDEHEQIMSGVLGIPTIKETSFSDFSGTVKSLGAWGGDFVLMSWQGEKMELIDYLSRKGMKTVFEFSEIVLDRRSFG